MSEDIDDPLSLFDEAASTKTITKSIAITTVPTSVHQFDNMVHDIGCIDGISDIWLSEAHVPWFRAHSDMHQAQYDHEKMPKDIFQNWLKDKVTKDHEWKYSMDFAYMTRVGDHSIRYRVNVFMSRGTVNACMRIITTKIPHHRDLGLPESVVKDTVQLRDGLAFFCGATGSGKSTSIAALLSERAAQREDHIITLEDPIEYAFPNTRSLYHQRQKGPDFPSFSQGIIDAMRESPDTIVIGEIRDRETAENALHAAETGHFVISTLHTRRAGESINRFRLLFPEDQQDKLYVMLSTMLRYVVCQRLVRNVEGKRSALFEVMHVNTESNLRPVIRSGKIDAIANTIQSSGYSPNFSFEKHLEVLNQRRVIDKTEYNMVKAELALENDL
jgi:twitching motility protein PilT